MQRIYDNLQTHIRSFADNMTTLQWCTPATNKCILAISRMLTIVIDPGNNTYDCSISFRDEQWRQHCTMFPDDIAVLTSTEDVYNENDVLIFHRQDRWHILYQTIIDMYMLYLGMYIVMDEEVRTPHHAYQLH